MLLFTMNLLALVLIRRRALPFGAVPAGHVGVGDSLKLPLLNCVRLHWGNEGAIEVRERLGLHALAAIATSSGDQRGVSIVRRLI